MDYKISWAFSNVGIEGFQLKLDTHLQSKMLSLDKAHKLVAWNQENFLKSNPYSKSAMEIDLFLALESL